MCCNWLLGHEGCSQFLQHTAVSIFCMKLGTLGFYSYKYSLPCLPVVLLWSALESFKFGATLCESDTHPEQFHTKKFKFTVVVSFTVLRLYRISVENAKDENFKVIFCTYFSTARMYGRACQHPQNKAIKHMRRKQFHFGGGERNTHCDRGDLHCMYEYLKSRILGALATPASPLPPPPFPLPMPM